jgi:hypothetical protein
VLSPPSSSSSPSGRPPAPASTTRRPNGSPGDPVGADQRAGALGHDLEHLGDGAGAVDVDGRVREVAQQLGVALGGARGGLAQLGEVEVRAHAGDQLARGERLDEVVVGAGRQPLDGGLLAGAGREHDHRQLRRRRVGAQPREQPEAVELGHHRVREDQVGPARAHRLQRGAAVAHRLDVPMTGEQPLEVVAQVGVVVGDQDPRALRLAAVGRQPGADGVVLADGLARVGQPAQRLLEVGGGTAGRGRRGGRRGGLLQRHAHAERRAGAGLADGGHAAAVQARELLHEREPDAAALVGARARAADALEALEQARELVGGDPRAGVGDAQDRVRAVAAQGDPDLALERELERVGDEVEHDPLPHLPVHARDHRAVRAPDHERDAGAVGRGAEHAREVGREGREIGRLRQRLGAAALDAGELEQVVDELLQAQRVAEHDAQPLPLLVVDRLGERIFGRPQDQRQRRAELVADVGEEVGLGAVELGERLGPLALGLARPHAGQARGELARDQLEEAAVLLVERPVGVQTGDDQPGRGAAPGLGERDRERLPRRLVPRPGRHAGAAVEIDDRGRAREQRGVRPVRGAGVGRGELARLAGRVGEREGQVVAVGGERAVDRGEQVALAGGRARGLGELAQGGQPALAEHAVGLLDDDAQHPRRLPALVAERAVGERVVGLLAVAAALQEQPQVLVPRRGPARHHRLDPRADVAPDLGPDLVGAPAERPRVLGRQRVGRVRVVVEERQLGAPRHPHREAGAEHDAHGRLQALRPALGRAERGRRPVERRDPLVHAAVWRRAGRAFARRDLLGPRVGHPAEPTPTGSPPGSPASR